MIRAFINWLKSGAERRSAARESGDGLTAFYWDGGNAHPHRVKDISRKGAYVEAGSVSWPQGTVMILTLQTHSDQPPGGTPPETLAVQTEVVRTSGHGMGLQFVLPRINDRRALYQFLSRRKTNGTSSHRLSNCLTPDLIGFCRIRQSLTPILVRA
jgi:hypothetical protein